jgi:hypothetical protein
MQPYQKAAEALRSGEEYPLQLLKNAGLTAIGGGAASLGSKALGKLIPAVGALINQYVPDKLSMAGLSKIDPRFGKFIEGALQEGYTYDELRKFMGDKLEKSQPAEIVKEQRNIIEQESPDLHQFIIGKIKEGRSPQEAGALAILGEKGTKAFKKDIEKIVSQHKTPWSQLLESVYGTGQTAQPQQPGNALAQEAMSPPGSSPIGPTSAESQAFNQPQQQQPVGQGQQALMQILQKINQKLGG